ncbi:hypothetical protein V8C42DRAFT_330518 [Trichoderma barbatum]
MSLSLQLLPPKLEYGGNQYSQLSREEQSSIYKELSKRCHPLDILRQQRHILDKEELPANIPNAEDLGIHMFMASPKRYPSISRRNVVAIACQWGMSKSRRNEPLAICAIDVLTGETLIDSLISFTQPMRDWRSDAHGIGKETISAAARAGECLQGWQEARTKLFEYIDEQTILVGHNTRFVLELLRLFHTKIVDSQVLAISAIFITGWRTKKGYKPPMYYICRDFLGITLRQNTDCNQTALENALASREIILKHIQRPKDWEEWARLARLGLSHLKEGNDDVKKNGHSDASPDKQKSAISTQYEDQIAAAYDDGYDDGYDAAYHAGFQAGYQKGCQQGHEKAYAREDHTWPKNDDMDQHQNEAKYDHSEVIQYEKKEDGFDDQNGRAGQNSSSSDDWDPAAQTGGLLAQLMKDDRIREMTQSTNGNEKQKMATRSRKWQREWIAQLK